MPFITGTARTPSELLSIMNTHLTSNGWTKIRGEEDLACASPKAARYWRIVVWETQTTSSLTRGLGLFNLRATPGGANIATVGANFSCSNFAVGTPSNMVSGGSLRSANLGSDSPWTVTYDFGTPTTVREAYIRADSTTASSPRSFGIQWSNDGRTWTTMEVRQNLVLAGNAFATITFNTGFLNSQHVTSSVPRRSGSGSDLNAGVNLETNGARDLSDDIWIWQGPGYDASRRTYIHMRGHCFQATATHCIELSYSVDVDTNINDFLGHPGQPGGTVFHAMGSGTITYWIYSNSHRVILITKTGATDYASSYVGFLSAFATPDNYPFPLFMSSTSNVRSTSVSETNGALGSMVDPGSSACCVRKWDAVNYFGGNRVNSSQDGNLVSGLNVGPLIWPYHFGKTSASDRWPSNRGSGTNGSSFSFQHMFESLIPTVQAELPMMSAIVFDKQHGNLGAMTGCFAIPGGGILGAEQLITIGSDDYRVFPNRNRRSGSSWFAVKEE